MHANFQHNHQAELAQLRTTLIEEGEANKIEALDYLGIQFKTVFLGIQFKTVFAKSEQEVQASYAAEITEMSARNDRLQDELAAAERSLRTESEAKSGAELPKAAPKEQAVPPTPAPQPRAAFSSPHEIPESLRYLFQSAKGSSVPPGFGDTPKNQNVHRVQRTKQLGCRPLSQNNKLGLMPQHSCRPPST